MAELWDACDRDFNLIPGVTLIRGEAIPEGMYHIVVDVIVRHRDGTFLLMRRDPRKPFGGMWELTAGGSALQGETPVIAALRELREETGIAADSLRELGRACSDVYPALHVIYLCETDIQKDAVTLQEGETVAWRWADRETILAMPDSELVSRRAAGFMRRKEI